MDNEWIHALQERYTLEEALWKLEAKQDELSQAVKEAKYNLRTQEEKVLTYGSSFRGMLDKLAGKAQDKAEELHRDQRKAEAALRSLLQEQDARKAEKETLTASLQALPDLDTLREAALPDPKGKSLWAALEIRFCSAAVLPLLEENYNALLEYRKLQQGNRPGEILSYSEQQQVYAAPNTWSEKCRPLLLRLQAALEIQEISFDLGSYYQSPTSYLVSAAAKHNRMDRVNQAMDQVITLRKQITRLLQTELPKK